MTHLRRLRIFGGHIVLPDAVVPNREGVWVEGETLVGVNERVAAEGDWEPYDATGCFIAPGFIDVHVHGGAGADFLDGTVDAALTAAAYHASGGTTALLATTGAESLPCLLEAIEAVEEARARNASGSRLLGVHLEGPYFNFEKKGCHRADQIRNPEPSEYRCFLERAEVVRWMTLAPELPGAEGLLRALAEHGIVASAGHTNATTDQIQAAISWGLKHTTHLYNAMSGVLKFGAERRGGVVEASLLFDALTTELIADGHHLPPELMRLAVKCKGVDRILLVTDAQRAAGMPDGEYEFGRKGQGTPFVVQNRIATMRDGSGFASSTIRMMDAVRVAQEKIGVSLADAVKMASLNPARVLGVDKRFGSLERGKSADIVLFDDQWRVHTTFVGGRPVYPERGVPQRKAS